MRTPGSILAGLAIASCAWCAGARAQTIDITSLPPYGSAGSLQGVVSGVNPATHRVVTYIQPEGAGWWVKPTTASPTVPIQAGGSFSVNVVTGGLDRFATIFAVALIPSNVPPPPAGGLAGLPQSAAFLALDIAERFGPTLSFAGRTWAIKESPLAAGPNANYFSTDPAHVWVDGQGRLHLTNRFQGGVWWSTEVILLGPSLGYGTYQYTLETEPWNLDADSTFGAFLWDSYGDSPLPGNPNRELDGEDSRWGNPADPTTSQFVVQPYGTPGNLFRYTVPLLGGSPTLTRFIQWEPSQVHFVAATGTPPHCAIPPASVIAEWTYLHDPGVSHYVPAPGRERFRFNLWLNDALPHTPQSGQTVEVIVSDFRFDCAPFCAGATYCTAGTSASGCQPVLDATGTASATAAAGFTLTVGGAEGAKAGLFFFGTGGRQANPWGNGTSYQCVIPPVQRAGLLAGAGTSGLCDGSFAQDLNALWCPACPRPSKNPGAGATVQAQLWYRDPLNTGNQATGLSAAFEFCVGP